MTFSYKFDGTISKFGVCKTAPTSKQVSSKCYIILSVSTVISFSALIKIIVAPLNESNLSIVEYLDSNLLLNIF
jgi:hypothetical protein